MTRNDLAFNLLIVLNGGTAPSLQESPATSLEVILTTIRDVLSGTDTIVGTNFDNLLIEKLAVANGGDLPATMQEAPNVSLETIFWNIAIILNGGSVPTLSDSLPWSRESILASITFSPPSTLDLLNAMVVGYGFQEGNDNALTPLQGIGLDLWEEPYGSFNHADVYLPGVGIVGDLKRFGFYSGAHHEGNVGFWDSTDGITLAFRFGLIDAGTLVAGQTRVATIYNALTSEPVLRIGVEGTNLYWKDPAGSIWSGIDFNPASFSEAYTMVVRLLLGTKLQFDFQSSDGTPGGWLLDTSNYPTADFSASSLSAEWQPQLTIAEQDRVQEGASVNPYKGVFSDFFMWNRCLSDDEVAVVLPWSSVYPFS